MADYKAVTTKTLADINKDNALAYETADDFEESDHPRNQSGQFSAGGGGKSHPPTRGEMGKGPTNPAPRAASEKKKREGREAGHGFKTGHTVTPKGGGEEHTVVAVHGNEITTSPKGSSRTHKFYPHQLENKTPQQKGMFKHEDE